MVFSRSATNAGSSPIPALDRVETVYAWTLVEANATLRLPLPELLSAIREVITSVL
jgi:hypothetical protein